MMCVLLMGCPVLYCLVELERRLSVRKSREELVKRGLLKADSDANNGDQQASNLPKSDNTGRPHTR